MVRFSFPTVDHPLSTGLMAWHTLCNTSVAQSPPLAISDRRRTMKLVTVVIKPFKLEDVREALSSVGIQGLTVTEVKGFGRQKGHAELYRGAEYSVNFLPKVKIDVAIADDQLDSVVDVLGKAAYTGKIGDGKIFVAELQRVIRIRTGETDEAAL
jgi:nitrogen regulatory protein P-II 2